MSDVADGIAAGFAQAGGQLAFGVPGGGANLDLVGALEGVDTRFVLVHGETSAAFMAAAVGELTGTPSLCLATRGPGATSMVNGVAHALLDRAALVAVTDAIPPRDRLRIGHQRLSQRELYAACAKGTAEVGGSASSETMLAAMAYATRPAWGPVHLDVGDDACAATDFPSRPPAEGGDLSMARRLMRQSRRPVIVCGVGSRQAEGAVGRIATELQAPVLTTYKAKGAVPDDSVHAAGLFTGGAIERPVLDRADLILMVGVDPVELIPGEWPYTAAVLSVAPWATPDPYFPVDVELVGEVEGLLDQVADGLNEKGWPVSGQEMRATMLEALMYESAGFSPHTVVETVSDVLGQDATLTVDAGAHMLVAMPFWQARTPQSVLISNGLATMGFALPAAIGTALARPGTHVVCMVGDAGLGMCLAELETLNRLQLPVTVIVFNDSQLSLIKIKQRAAGHGGPSAVRYGDIDFCAVARGLGLSAVRVEDGAALRSALTNRTAAPLLIDAIIDPACYAHVMAAIRTVPASAVESVG